MFKNPKIGLLTYSGTNDHTFLLPQGVRHAARQHGYDLIVHATLDLNYVTQQWVQNFPAVHPGNVQGLIFAYSNPVLVKYAEELARSGFPTVLVARESKFVTSVLPDNAEGIRNAVAHLVEHGHKRIAFLTGPKSNHSAEERFEGYLGALDEFRLGRDSSLIIPGGFIYEDGFSSMQEFLRMKIPFTGLVCANDNAAHGAIHAIQQAGFEVPSDIAVIGFDNLPMSSIFFPPLSSHTLPSYELGWKATELLVDQIQGRMNEPQSVRVRSNFVRRSSCGCRFDVVHRPMTARESQTKGVVHELAVEFSSHFNQELNAKSRSIPYEKGVELAGKLIDSVADRSSFLKNLSSVFCDLYEAGFDPSYSQQIISILYEHLISSPTDQERNPGLEPLFQEARILVNDLTVRYQSQQYLSERHFLFLMRSFRQHLAISLELSNLQEALRKLLDAVGVKSAILIRHSVLDNDGVTGELVFWKDQCTSTPGLQKKLLLRTMDWDAFLSHGEGSRAMVLLSLNVEQEELGWLILEMDNHYLRLFRELAEQIAIFLKNSSLFHALQEQRKLAEIHAEELQQAKNKLVKANERFELASTAVQSIVYDVDLTASRIHRTGCLAEVFGYNVEEVEATLEWWMQRIHPEDQGRIQNHFSKAVREGKNFAAEYRFRNSRGNYLFLFDRAKVIRDASGNITRLVGTVINISERKEQEDLLQAEKEQLSVTLSSIADGVITTDMPGNVVLMNRVAEALTGWTHGAAIGRHVTEILKVELSQSCPPGGDPIRSMLESERQDSPLLQAKLRSRDGSDHLVCLHGSPIRNRDNQVLGVVLVLQDITHKQRMEEELIKGRHMQSLGLLAGGIAHDFNNILTIILANLSLAEQHLESPEVILSTVQSAQKATHRGKDLARQLLTFSKGGAPIRKSASIARLVAETTELTLTGSSVKGKFEIPPDLWDVEVDTGQMSQVITNLVLNAIQAMPSGGMLKVSCDNIEMDDALARSMDLKLRNGSYVKISLQDGGSGIQEGHLKFIFDPFFTTKPKGNGLGLTVSKSIIQNHDGAITVRSKVNEGSTFEIFLPSSRNQIFQKPTVSPKPRILKGKVLIMDDEDQIREIISKSLRLAGYEVAEAENGQRAIDLFKEAEATCSPFQVIVMDLTVPGGMGGAEAMSVIRSINPKARAIVCSGYSDDPVMANYTDYGFCGVVMKPYDLDMLKAAISEALSGITTGEATVR